jgi:hypothetical protein
MIKEMEVREMMAKNVALVRDWYDSLDEGAKDTTAVYMVMGDMEGKCNCDFLAGMGEDIVYTLAQSMVNDRDFYDMAKAAIELVDKFNDTQLEELKESMLKKSINVVS